MPRRPPRADDLDALVRWLREPEVVELWGGPDKDIEAIREEYLESDVDPCWRFVFKLDGAGVGLIQYWHNDPGPSGGGAPASATTTSCAVAMWTRSTSRSGRTKASRTRPLGRGTRLAPVA